MKRVTLVLIGILVLTLVFSFAKDILIQVSVEKAVQLVTGLPLKMQSLRLGIISQEVDIRNLRLFNPKGFKDEIMLNMPQIYVDYDLGAFFAKKIHLQRLRIDLQEFIVVRNEQGQLNLDSLKVVQAQKSGAPAKAPAIQIDTFELKVGRVLLKDYSKGPSVSIKEFNINLNEKYSNISDPNALVSLIVVKALMNTSIAGLVNFDLAGLRGVASGALSSAQQLAGDAVVTAEKAIRQTSQAAQQAAQDTGQILKKTTEEIKGLKDSLKLPFGK